MEPTTHNAGKVATALQRYVNTLLLAQVNAQLEREKMDALDRRLLAEQSYTDRYKRTRVTDPKYTWCIVEDELPAFYARRQGAIGRMGYDLPKDHCPALVAEHLEVQATWALILAAEEFFPGMDNDALLCAGMAKRKAYIDLLIKLVVNAPHYEPPDIIKRAG